MKIKIMDTPPGFAPEEIRKAWVGLVLDTSGREKKDQGAVRIGTENLGGYKVSTTDALLALRKENRTEAFNFWSSFNGLGATLVFDVNVCKEFKEEEVETHYPGDDVDITQVDFDNPG